MSDELAKKFEELLENSNGRVLVSGQNAFGVVTFLPYLLRSLSKRHLKVVVCGENFGRLQQLLKRIGLGSADFCSFEMADLFAKLSSWVEPDYPITSTAHKHAPVPLFAPKLSEQELFSTLGQLLEPSSRDVTVIIPDIEYLLMAVFYSTDGQAAPRLLDRLLGMRCESLIIGVNSEVLKTSHYSMLYNWLLSHFDARLKICSLRSGSSPDVTGLVKTQYTIAATLAKAKGTVKFKAHSDKITFVEA